MGGCISSNGKAQRKQMPRAQDNTHLNNNPLNSSAKENPHNQEKIILSQKLFKIQGDELNTLIHRSIGALTWLNKSRHKVVGSGVLISKNMVLTVAHNVYDRKQNQQFTDFKFYLGANGTAKHYYEVEGLRFLEEYKYCDSMDNMLYDFALLKLKKQVQYKQFLKIAVPCKICLLQKNFETCLQIYGFPGQYQSNYNPLNKFGSQFQLSQYGLGGTNRIVVIDSQKQKIGYGISTLPGQSGCPVILGEDIIAIHSGGGKSNEQFNVARLIDFALLSSLESWGRQLKGHGFQINTKGLCSHVQQSVKDHLSKNGNHKHQSSVLNQQCLMLKEINLSNQIYLTEVNLSDNKISQIDISKNINLTQLNLSSNQLSGIDTRKNVNLTQLSLWSNKLSIIDIGSNIGLSQLYLWNNQLSAIDTSNNIRLTQLYLSSNRLSVIDVSKNTELTQLSLWNNKLTSIDISRNVNLTQVYLYHNKLQTFDARNNTNLTQLHVNLNSLNVIFLPFFTRHYLASFSHQSSTICQVYLLYNQEHSQKCKEKAKEYFEKYRIGGKYNKNKCAYAFIPSQRF